jgi:uncharacterized membrane protein YcaP (DUF421 family)
VTAARVLAAIPPVTVRRLEIQAAKTLIVMTLLVVGFRLLGKREAAQLNVYDLAMLMALANAVQNAMTGGLGNLPIGLVTSSTLIVSAWALSLLFRHRPGLERRLIGSPTILVRDGRLLTDRLRRSLVTPDEVDEACRQHGVASPADAALAVLEVDGSISIVPKGTPMHRVTPARRRRRQRAWRRSR